MSTPPTTAFTPLVPDTDAPNSQGNDGSNTVLTAEDTLQGSSSYAPVEAWTAHDWIEASAPAQPTIAAAANFSSAAVNLSADASASGAIEAPAQGSESLAPFITNQTGGSGVSDTADQVLKANTARSTFDVDGTGIKIGIISDSFNDDGLASQDEADGALPSAANVHILQDGTGGTDEGRAMAQIVHSIAPGAQIYFYTAGDTDQSMAQAITALQQAGCQVIVDDVTFFDEPFYEEGGTISGAVDQATANGTAYFTAAGNAAESFYEGTFNPVAVGATVAENFNIAGSLATWLDPITIPQGAVVDVDLQWNQPFLTADGAANGFGSTNSLGFELFNSSGVSVYSSAGDAIGGDPIQFGQYTNRTGSTTLYLAVFENVSGEPAPGEFKIVMDDDSFSPVTLVGGGVGSGTSIGHEDDPNAITVGAAPETAPTRMEVFSSVGPGSELFDANGNPLPAPASDGKMNVVGVDGNTTSVPGFPTFYGTSAAAPTAAAVGALLLQENPQLDPDDIANLLEDTATPIAGPSDLTGAGLVNALAAVGDAGTLIITASAGTTTLLGTHLNDSFIGGPGSHTINGEGGTNTLDYSKAPAGVTVNFTTGLATNGYGSTDSFTNIQIAKGSAFADDFIAGAAGATLYSGGGANIVDFSALGAGGMLALDGSFTASLNSTDNKGAIDFGGGSLLTIVGAVENDGSIIANGANVDLSGAVTGTGSALVEDGGVIEIGGADGAGVSFGGTAATLELVQPASFGGTIGGLALGDKIDFVSLAVTRGVVQNSILTITESGGATLTFTLSGQLAGNGFTVAGDGHNGTDLTLSPNVGLAAATMNDPATISLGNIRVGGILGTTLSITNSAAAPSEGLDVSVGGTTRAATAHGTINLLGTGQTDATDIVVGLNTMAAGAQGGSVKLALASDGSATDGQGVTPLPGQTVQLTGKVYREATGTVTAPSNLIVHVGDGGGTVSEALTVANIAASDGFSEHLIGTVVGSTGSVTGAGSTGEIAAQGTSTGLAALLSTATAGPKSGTVTVDLQSDGTTIDGFGPTDLGDQAVTVSATVNNFAAAVIEEISGGGTWSQSGTSYTLNLGTLPQGTSPLAIDLGVLNAAVGPADLLSGSFVTSGGSAFALSGFTTFSSLAAGQADTAAMVTLATGTAGTFSETISVDPTGSNASGYSGGLASETLTITGTIQAQATDNLAQATLNTASPLNLGNARVGGTLGSALSITNSAAPPAEALDASLSGATGDATESGAISRLADGATDTSHIAVGLGTATAGAESGTVTLNFRSDGAGTDGSGTTSIGSQTVTLTGDVYNEAAPLIGPLPTNFIVHVGDHVAQALTLTNTAPAGGFSENLTASIAGTTGGITAQGSPGAIAAGGSGSAVTLGFSTANAGTVAGSVTLNLNSDGTGIDGLGAVSLGPQTVAVNATVDNFAKAALHEISGGGSLVANSATSYTLSLGSVARGAAPGVVNFAAFNATAGPADLLAGSFSASSTTGFTVAGLGGFGGLAAGQADNAPSVTLNTGTGGSFTETITLTSTGSNSSGYSGALANITLTITDTVVTSSTWNGPTVANRSGNWNTPSNWSGAIVPSGTMAAVISNAGTYTVTSTQSNSVGTLTLSDGSATLAVAGGTLAVLGNSTNAGTIAVGDGDALQLTGALTNSGTIALNASGDATALTIAGAATISGGHVTLGAAAGNEIVSNGAAAALTNASTIQGAGTIGDASLSLTNGGTGVINANSATAGLAVTGHAITNSGTIEATAAGGLTIATTVTNSIGTIAAAGGAVTLAGATINGGTLKASTGSVIATSGGPSTLSGTTSSGTVAVTDGTSLRLAGTITNNGTIALNKTGSLVIAAAATNKGTGSITLGDAVGNSIASAGVAVTLTNETTIAGSGKIGDGFLTLVNYTGGVIDATGTAAALTLGGTKGVTNYALIEVTGAAGLIIATTVTQAAGGLISAAGGNVYVQGATITAGTLSAASGNVYLQNGATSGTGTTVSASGGSVYLQGATIGASTLQNSGGGVIATGGGVNTLSGSTVAGTVSVTDGTSLRLQGTVTDNGAIALNSTGDATALVIAAATTLKGTGHVTLGDNAGNAIVSAGVTETLINETTIAGSGMIGDSFLSTTNYAGGVIDATGTAVALTLGGTKTVTNYALIEATGAAGLIIATAVTQTAGGVIAAAGGSVYVQGAAITAGTLSAASGNVYLQNGATSGTGTTVSASGGSVYLQGATIGASTLQNSGGGVIATGGGVNTLSGSTVAGTVSVTDGTSLRLQGTVTDNGAIALNSTGDATALVIAAATTLKGTGHVTLGNNAGNAVVSSGVAETLTNETTIAGSGKIGDNFLSVTNYTGGVIDATGTAAALTLGGTKTVTNYALIEATGAAGLIIATAVTQTAGGVIAAAGGNVYVQGVTITAGTLSAASGNVYLQNGATSGTGTTVSASGGSVYLQGATIGASTLQNSGGGVIATGGGVNTLSGSTVAGTVSVTDGTSLRLQGTVTDNGAIALNSTGDATALVIAAATTLKGTGHVTLGDNAGNAIVSVGVAETLTNETTIAGSGTIGDNFLSVTNAAGGIIDASGTAAALKLGGTKSYTNSGLIEATGNAGLVLAAAVVGGAGGVIAAAGGNVLLEGATLSGDTLQTSLGGVIETVGGTNTLSGGTLTGTVAVSDGTALTLQGTITNNGTLALDSAGHATSLAVAAAVTLAGTGEVAMTDAATNAIVSNGTAETLTNDETIAGSGTIGDTHLTLVNAAGAMIDATGTGAALTIGTTGHTVTNSGLIETTGSAGLTISGALANSGTLAASAGALTVAGAVTGTGQEMIAGGTLDFAGGVAATQAVTFVQNTTGMLDLGLAQSFAGTVAGLAAGDAIDLQNFLFGGGPAITGVSAITSGANTVGAAVTVKDGALSATLDLMNQFGLQYSTSASGYTLASDGKSSPGALLELAPPQQG